MSPEQRELARHALGLPNKKNVSYRNHFCTGKGSTDYPHWEKMVEQGDAMRRVGNLWGGDNMYYLTLQGALAARDSKEHLSREEAEEIRNLEEWWEKEKKIRLEAISKPEGTDTEEGPYKVGISEPGCATCGAGKTWDVVHMENGEEMAESIIFGEQEAAEDLADALNRGYAAGFKAAKEIK